MEHTSPVMKALAVDQLQLDLENPRHEPVITEEAVVEWMLDNDRQVKIFYLMKDMAENGWCVQNNLLIVIKNQAGRYVATDGNRRLCALKLLQNSELAKLKFRARIKKIAATVSPGTFPTELRCMLEPSREACADSLYRIHAKSGSNVIGWSSARKTMFARKNRYHDLPVITEMLVDEAWPHLGLPVEEKKNFSRPPLRTLLQSSAFQKHAGIEIISKEKEEDIRFHLKKEEALKPIVEVITALIEKEISAEDVSNKEKIQAYIDAQKPEHTPQDRTPLDKPISLVQSASTQKSLSSDIQKKNSRPVRRPRRSNYLISGQFSINSSNAKLSQIIKELKSLDLTKHPCAISGLIRQVIEIAVADAEGRYFEIAEKQPSLTQSIKKICKQLSANGWLDGRLAEGIQTGLEDPESLFNMSTMHGYIHNPTFIPAKHELEIFWKRYEPFIHGCYALTSSGA